MDRVDVAVHAAGGLVHVRRLQAAGVSRHELRVAVESRRLLRVRPAIYASPGAPIDLVRAARVGGRLAGASAAALHGVWQPPVEHLVVEVARGAKGLRHPDRLDRQLRDLDGVRLLWTREQRKAEDSIGLSPLLDCIAQCGRSLRPSWAAAVLDSAVRTGAVDVIDVASIRFALPRPARRLARLVDGRCESGSEFVLRAELELVGIASRPQVPVPGTDLDRFDLLIGDRLVIECDSERHHGDPQARRRDRRRDARVTSLGFIVLRFDYVQIQFEIDDVLASIRRYVDAGLHLHRPGYGQVETRAASPA